MGAGTEEAAAEAARLGRLVIEDGGVTGGLSPADRLVRTEARLAGCGDLLLNCIAHGVIALHSRSWSDQHGSH